jgi:hypothetical protein
MYIVYYLRNIGLAGVLKVAKYTDLQLQFRQSGLADQANFYLAASGKDAKLLADFINSLLGNDAAPQ